MYQKFKLTNKVIVEFELTIPHFMTEEECAVVTQFLMQKGIKQFVTIEDCGKRIVRKVSGCVVTFPDNNTCKIIKTTNLIKICSFQHFQ